MTECSRCSNARRALHATTPAWCSRCHRWQMLYQLPFADFPGAQYRHLSCVQCHVGAWCRDFWTRPNAAACAKSGHVEAFDQHTVSGSFVPKSPTR
jgi:hypothetical protein